MSNFWKQKVARESAEVELEAGSIELPEEAVEAHLEEVQDDTTEIELLDRDAAVLADDTAETEAQIDLVEEGLNEDGEDDGETDDLTQDEAEAIDVAQESIRRRWGLSTAKIGQECRRSRRSRRVVAREGLYDDLKAMIQRFIEWLNEQGRKLKDRWLKFSNAGKTIQSRAKKYDAAVSKLGAKKSDTIKGGFIKQLLIGTEFTSDAGKIKGMLDLADKGQTEAQKLYDGVAGEVAKALNGETDNYAQFLNDSAVFGNSPTQIIGGKVVKAEVADSSAEDHFSTLEFVDNEKEAPEEVATPSSSELSTLVDLYNVVGKRLEKQIQAYHTTNKARAKLEESMNKIKKELDKLDSASEGEGNKTTKGAIGRARKAAAAAAAKASKFDSIAAHVWKVVPAGLGGYIQAGIGAYAKK